MDLHIEGQKDKLEIICKSGLMSMKGNSILADPRKFFEPVLEWAREYVKDPEESTEVNLKFEYIDTASVQRVFDILKVLKDIPDSHKKVVINWYFEFDDPELLEVGEIMEGRLKLKFNFIEYDDGGIGISRRY